MVGDLLLPPVPVVRHIVAPQVEFVRDPLLAEEVPNGATAFKCCPPVREVGNRELLWEGLIDGTIDFIVSDHSPSTLDLKDLDNGDFGVAWGGIAGLQVALPAV